VGLDERTLTESPVFDDWTAKDLLAHVAAWDELYTERIALILAGRKEETTGIVRTPAMSLSMPNAEIGLWRKQWRPV